MGHETSYLCKLLLKNINLQKLKDIFNWYYSNECKKLRTLQENPQSQHADEWYQTVNTANRWIYDNKPFDYQIHDYNEFTGINRASSDSANCNCCNVQ